jgi:hypothetical protein
MRIPAILFLLAVLSGCSEKKAEPQKALPIQKAAEPEIIDATFPFAITEMDGKNAVRMNDGVQSEIEKILIDDFAEDFGNDSLAKATITYKDLYIKTVRLHDTQKTIFLVVMKGWPGNTVYSKALFYDNTTKEFAKDKLFFRLHALYDYTDGKLAPTNLKKTFLPDAPEIERTDFNKDGITDYKFTRLFHNGTANAIETIILNVKNNTLDTLYFNQKFVGPGTEKP